MTFLIPEHIATSLGLVGCADVSFGSSRSGHGCDNVTHTAYGWQEASEAAWTAGLASARYEMVVLEQI